MANIRLPACIFMHAPEDTLKMIRETLCVVQIPDGDRAEEHRTRIGRMIEDIDRQRPIGPDGKHGDLHTALCGCESRRMRRVGGPDNH